jgi:hypothetical protein
MDKKDWEKHFRRNDIESWMKGGVKLIGRKAQCTMKASHREGAPSPGNIRDNTVISDTHSVTRNLVRASVGQASHFNFLSKPRTSADFASRSENHIKPYSGSISPSTLFKPHHDSSFINNSSVYKVAEQSKGQEPQLTKSRPNITKVDSPYKSYFSPPGSKTNLFPTKPTVTKSSNSLKKPKNSPIGKSAFSLAKPTVKPKEDKGIFCTHPDHSSSNIPTTRPISNDDNVHVISSNIPDLKKKTDATSDKTPKSGIGQYLGIYSTGLTIPGPCKSKDNLSKSIEIEKEDPAEAPQQNNSLAEKPMKRKNILAYHSPRAPQRPITTFTTPRYSPKKEVSPSVHRRVSVLKDQIKGPFDMRKKTSVFFTKSLNSEQIEDCMKHRSEGR